MEERRRLAVLVPYRILEALVRDRAQVQAFGPIPVDARLVAVEASGLHESVFVVFEHPSFNRLPETSVVEVTSSLDWSVQGPPAKAQ